MKASNEFFLSYGFLGILLVTFLFAISLYLHDKSNINFYATQGVQSMIGSNNGGGSGSVFLAGAQTDFAFSKFDQIKSYGKWDITVKRGDKYQVTVFAEKEKLGGVLIEQQGDLLSFTMKGGLFSVFKGRISAEVVLPHVKKIEAALGSKIAFSDFKGEGLSIVAAGASYLNSQNNNFKRVDIEASSASKVNLVNDKFNDLTVDISGAAYLTAKASETVNLSLEASGGSRADLTSSKVTNAMVDLSGASRLTVNMNGGHLKGEASGASKVSYSGEVSTQEITASGASSVVKR